MSESEVARTRAKIERECEALRLLMQGFATVASHETITGHYQRLGEYQTRLEQVVGSEEAMHVLCEIYNKYVQ
jgi:hypothetical protein